MTVILGASGATGGALLQRLTELGLPSRALTRDPDALRARLGSAAGRQVEILAADATDPDSLRAAFKGARQLFLTMANSPQQVELELRCVRAAVDSGIEHIVKISAPAAEPDSPVAISRGHHTVERYLADSGVTHTVLRPYAFMQKLLLLAPAIAGPGLIHGAMRDAPCNYIDCRDIADVAAEVLTRPELAGQTYTLTGAETFSYPELAATLSLLLDRPIHYLDLPPQGLHDHLVQQARMPHWLATHVVEIQQLALTHPEHPTPTVTHLLGRSPRSLDAFLREHLTQFRPR